MNTKDRLLEFLKYLEVGQNKFESNVGISNGYINNNKGSVGSDIIYKISEAFPDLNVDWLITGKGKMLKSMDIQVLNHPKAVEKKLEEQEITLYDVSAAANLKTLFDHKSENILGKISIPDMPRCDGAVFVTGDSMYPLLKSGDIIAYKEVRNFDNVIFGEMYLVSFEMEGDEFLTVKYVNRSEMEGCIKLVSYNQHHDPKDIPLSCVRAMALVKLSVRKNTMR